VLSYPPTELPFGADLLFEAVDVPGLVVHAEVCEDMWVPIPPSAEAALAGATVLLNLSGSPITIARAETRKLLCRSASQRCVAAYVYAADHKERYAEFFARNGSLVGPGYTTAEAAGLPAQYRVPGIVVKAAKPAA